MSNIKIKALVGVAAVVLIYTLRPMPEYDLQAIAQPSIVSARNHSQDSGSFMQAVLEDLQVIAVQASETQAVSANGKEISEHVSTTLSTSLSSTAVVRAALQHAAVDLHRRLRQRFGDDIGFQTSTTPGWVSDALAIVEVIAQMNQPPVTLGQSDAVTDLEGDLAWLKRAATDLSQKLKARMPGKSPTWSENKIPWSPNDPAQ